MDDPLPAALASDLDRAFERLVLDHQDRLFSIAFRILGQSGDAEEVAQDALVRAYRALQAWDPARIRSLDVRPWLAAIVVNLCRNRLRRRRPAVVPLDAHRNLAPEPVTADPRDSPHDTALRREAAVRWGDVLLELPERYRTPVVLRHVDGLSYDEIAEVLGRPAGTVKAQVHRGLAQLRAAAAATRLDRQEMTA